jgi:hypothetical protein
MKMSNREIQRRNTKEARSLEIFEEANRALRVLVEGFGEGPLARVLEKAIQKQGKELIRLRRELISERSHRERLVKGLIPRLRSKANEVRGLRKKLYGNESRVTRRRTVEIA